MTEILHTALVYSTTAMATLLALTLTLTRSRLIARFAPDRRRR